MYQVDRVYIWQNQVGELAYLNGTETTVIDAEMRFLTPEGRSERGWPTDTTKVVDGVVWVYFAQAGDLRPKDLPPGEQSILNLFKQPEPETV